MDFIEPVTNGFTIYSKSGCLNCNKVKALLKDKNIFFSVIDCDDYLLDNKEIFLLFVKEKTGQDVKTFPIVFNHGKFIGGYKETQEYIDKEFLSFD